jgi:hypothetical protein
VGATQILGEDRDMRVHVTSQAASRRGSGGAAWQARAYRPIGIRRSSPTLPEESSMYWSAAVTRSTEWRVSGAASAALPAVIIASITVAT